MMLRRVPLLEFNRISEIKKYHILYSNLIELQNHKI